MSAPRHSKHAPSAHAKRLAVGADLGGTWLRVVARDGAARVTRAQLRIAGRDPARALAEVLQQRGWTRARIGALAVAARGVWTARERADLRRRLRALAPRVAVLSDAEAAWLGALDGRPGVVVLAGTGSIVVGRDARGRWARAGGLGPLLGDEGSAFWLGREWLRATAPDRVEVRALVMRRDAVGAIAAVALAVLVRARRGDRRARAIVADAQRHLARQALTVARRLRLSPPVAMSWAGSVVGNPWFRAGLVRAVRRAGLRARWTPPAFDPVNAAARLAVLTLSRKHH